ncbi:MAG: GDP-mannose 4,6-dehydratase [Actinomycetales bacterium]|nr:GDP-mannose 4,6-dehydratase [Actinomycetales bacterium]
MTRSLVTGAGGFVGRHLMAHLASCGDEVVGVDREVDVTDPDALEAAIAAAAPQVVYHLAAMTHVGESWARPEAFTRVNVLGTSNLLEAARRAAPEAVVLIVSSADVYGVVDAIDLPLDEGHVTRPASPYAQSKIEAERVAREAAHRGQRVVIVRPFNHIGPGQAPTFVVPALASRLLEARDAGATSVPVGDLSARRDFCDVRDVVRAYRLLGSFGAAGEVYNVASGYDVAIADVATWLVARIAPHVELIRSEALLRPVEVPVSRGSFAKLQRVTGWEPRIALRASLEDVVAELEAGRAR